jgi:hypothetical protein
MISLIACTIFVLLIKHTNKEMFQGTDPLFKTEPALKHFLQNLEFIFAKFLLWSPKL